MSILDHLDNNRVVVDFPSRSKKQVIEDLAKRVATQTGLNQRFLLNMVMHRGRLGKTGIGGGIAIPHDIHSDLTRTIAFLPGLANPVDFVAIDGKQVDIICLVIGPPNDRSNYLKCISSVTQALQQSPIWDKLRAGALQVSVLQSLNTLVNVAA